MHEQGLVSISAVDLKGFLANMFEEYDLHHFGDPADFLRNICKRTNILVWEPDDKSFHFFHLTIQEYLAATQMANSDESKLVSNFLDGWWLNVNIFYAGENQDKSEVLKRVASREVLPSDIFDHLIAIIPEFGLRIYQAPSGHDFQALNHQNTNNVEQIV